MATLTASAQWSTKAAAKSNSNNLISKWTAFMESQSENKTLWFLLSLVVQGVFFLPVPAVLIYYDDAPILVLTVTLALFFANIIAGMGGAGIKTLLRLFAASIIVHALMVLICVL
ncbi:hypothetical protein SAMN05428975_4396 [Mucilaginibacter sp. OK268]|uniref:hypothetical protein n=1 Tax=Mucilaginibacter sp. OK268 TaxID=1881048 RepID=UPI0008922D0E|nr:hypothetical protein [Mucilaginibacter sp. OK268]SDP97062.1 hypothetical protein SAMN05428975_4396 [Mucilaginibacter sp. OK268]